MPNRRGTTLPLRGRLSPPTTPNTNQQVILGTTLVKLTDLNPLLRNDNTTNSVKKDGVGPHGIWKADDGTWQMITEAYGDPLIAANNDVTGPMRASATSLQGPWTLNPSAALVLTPNNSNWEFGEYSPHQPIWDAANNRWFMTAHGGNNQGPRQIGFTYSTDGKTGAAWTKSLSNPVLTPGASGTIDDNWLADLRLIQNRWTGQWIGFYRAQKVSGPSDGAVARVVGPSPDKLTKTGGVITVAPSWATNGYHVGDVWYDAGGRLHLFGASGALGIGYSYSDDDGVTWTWGNSSNAVLVPTVATGSPDRDSAGGTVRLVDDGDVLFITYHASNLTDASGGAAAPSRSPCAAITPAAKVTPTRKGKFHLASSYTTVSTTALLTQTVFTVMGRFRAYRLDRVNKTRMIYAENVSGGVFNKKFQMQMPSNQGGILQAFYRTPTASVSINSLAAVDDSLWHTFVFRRTAANAFELVIDGVSQGTSSLNPTTDATAVLQSFGNVNGSMGISDAPFNGTNSDFGLVTGYAASNSEALAWINNRTALGGGTVVFDSKINGADTGNVITVEAA